VRTQIYEGALIATLIQSIQLLIAPAVFHSGTDLSHQTRRMRKNFTIV
jgi:hypothetical protein